MVAASGHLDESKKRKTVTCQCSKQELVLGSEAEPSLVKNPPPRTVEGSDPNCGKPNQTWRIPIDAESRSKASQETSVKLLCKLTSQSGL